MRATVFSISIWLVIASGAFLFTSGALDWLESRGAQHEIAEEWRAQPSDTNPSPDPKSQSPSKKLPRYRLGSAIARLTIPRLDATLYVVEGTDDSDLKRGPGHLSGSVLPGQDGNCVIAGHRDTHFSMLKNIEEGDEIVLERDGHKFHYRVDGMKVITPENIQSLMPTRAAELNLITCYPFRYIGSAPKRFVVHASLEGAAAGQS